MKIKLKILFFLGLAASSDSLQAQSGRELRLASASRSSDLATGPRSLNSSGLVNELDKECLGDRIEAAEVGRQCSRRCKRDTPCENARKQCLCDGLCGMSCIKPDLRCPELPKPENGDYFPKSFSFNSKIVYSCNQGYYFFGSRERTCQGDEEWSGYPGECNQEPVCHNPIKVSHARNPSDGTYRLKDKVSYTCYPGYQSKGHNEAVCRLIEPNYTSWQWLEGGPFRCQPKSCGDPGQIENGRRHGESFIIASSVLYNCNEGFQVVGQARRYCQSDSQWSGQAPRCEPITCDPTDHLENGKINYAYPLVINSTVGYSCDYGFRLVGPQRRRCGPEGKLVGELPICEEIDCGHIGDLANGIVRGYSSRMGDKKEFICHEGTKFVGSFRESTCLETGNWSHPLPSCLAGCRVPQIDRSIATYVIAPELLQQNLTNYTLPSVTPRSLVSHGSLLEVVCDKSYELDKQLDSEDSLGSPRCQNGTWSYEPACRPASCRSRPPSPRNGRVRIASMEHGSKGYIHCLDGFRLKGPNNTQCLRGNWSSIDGSVCQEVYCNYPGVIEHGRVLLVGLTGMYDYKPYIRRISTNRQVAYECESGFRLADGAPSGATCMDGVWRPEGLPLCIKE